MYYDFHTMEAIASFSKSIRFDSTCAVAWYGKALALKPTINFGKDFRVVPAAYNDALTVKKREFSCTSMEKDLIDAIGLRYSTDTLADLKALGDHYTGLMKQVSEKYAQNADIVCFYADALMLEHPWDLYDGNLQSKPWTPLILNILQKALAIDSLHPGANHFIVQSLEGSAHPEDALKNAEMLATLMPDMAPYCTHAFSYLYT